MTVGDGKQQFVELLAHDTLESTRTRLEAFADSFERAADGRKQTELAQEFSGFVADIVRHPLTMGDLNGLIGLGHWLDVYASDFRWIGGSAEWSALVRELDRFGKECIAAHENWCRSGGADVQYPTITEAGVNELLTDIQKLTGRQFVYEDPWHGYVPMGDKLEEYHIGPPERFADLHWRDKADVLREFVGWNHYSEKGLGWRDRDTIQRNVVDGKPPDRWLEGTSLAGASQQLTEAKPQPVPLDKQFEEMLSQPAHEPAKQSQSKEQEKDRDTGIER